MSEDENKPMEKVYNDATGEYDIVKYVYKLVPEKTNENEEWERFVEFVEKRDELQSELDDVQEKLDLYKNVFSEDDIAEETYEDEE